jgi:hypothetical protein
MNYRLLVHHSRFLSVLGGCSASPLQSMARQCRLDTRSTM